MKRSTARELAIQLSFAAAAAGTDPEELMESFFQKEHCLQYYETYRNSACDPHCRAVCDLHYIHNHFLLHLRAMLLNYVMTIF